MEVKILIIEDEFPIALDIEQRLKKMGYGIVGIAGKYKDALVLLSELEYDMVLLDINLDDKKNGIDLGILIDQTFRVPVIFITAYSDKSTFLEAARANPMGFIVKPFNDIDLDRTIILAMNNFRRQNEEKYGNVKMEIEKESVFVKDKGKIKQITVNEILWLDAMENYTIINTSKERFVVNSFLKDVIDKLGNKFIRIHRSHAVAIDKIKSIEDNSLFIGSGCLNISQTYRKDLMERINLL